MAPSCEADVWTIVWFTAIARLPNETGHGVKVNTRTVLMNIHALICRFFLSQQTGGARFWSRRARILKFEKKTTTNEWKIKRKYGNSVAGNALRGPENGLDEIDEWNWPQTSFEAIFVRFPLVRLVHFGHFSFRWWPSFSNKRTKFVGWRANLQVAAHRPPQWIDEFFRFERTPFGTDQLRLSADIFVLFCFFKSKKLFSVSNDPQISFDRLHFPFFFVRMFGSFAGIPSRVNSIFKFFFPNSTCRSSENGKCRKFHVTCYLNLSKVPSPLLRIKYRSI